MMMAGWRKSTLGDICSFKYGQMPKKDELVESGYPVFSGYRLVGYSTRYHYRDPEIVVVARGEGGTGDIKMSPPFCFLTNLSIAALIESEDVDKSFLYYRLASTKLWNLRTGSAQAQITIERLRSYEVEIPPLPLQRRITGILTAYDELIENNQRRIRILEEMARSLYREWFVHFRYPGHESVPLVDSPLGQIPQGWEVISFESLLASMTGGDWGSELPEDRETAEVAVVRGTDFDEVAYGGQLRVPVRYIKPSSLITRGLKVGDVIIENSINAKSRSVGTTLLVDSHTLNRLGRDAIAASFCKVFRLHDPRIAPLVHLHVRHLREDARMEYYQNVAANGIANFQAQKFAKEEKLVLPTDESVRDKLIEPFASLFQSVGVLSSKLSNLRRTRDLLLPRLLSGRVSLSDAVSEVIQ